MTSIRLDTRLVQLSLAESRDKAQQLIDAGAVEVNGKKAQKASQKVSEEDQVLTTANPLRYVGRGGAKLEKALREFHLDLAGKTVLDIGASTGGFTDCALQHGASFVAAVDVGSGQLHPSLRSDPRVLSLEETDVRTLPAEKLPFPLFDLVVIDVSFISLAHIFPHALRFLKHDGYIIALVKPQFELGERRKFKKGIVSDKKLRRQAIEDILKAAVEQGLHLNGICATEVEENQKNIEYPVLLRRMPCNQWEPQMLERAGL